MEALLASAPALSIDRIKLQVRKPAPGINVLTRSSPSPRITLVAAAARKDAGALSDREPPPPPSDGAVPAMDRRELLAGTLAGSLAAVEAASAAPVGSPTLKRCQPAVVGSTFVACCAPKPKRDPIDFKPDSGPLRTRPAAHLVNEDYIAKYTEAYAKMRALPSDDPRSLRQQANVHCAYCNFGYRQDSDPKAGLQIHFNWLFLPWHRWYLYFHEKILGSLIGDPTFALPFWNWDNQEGGVYVPEMFGREGTALYNANRNTDHYAPSVVNLGFAPGLPDFESSNQRSNEEIKKLNLSVMYNNVAKIGSQVGFFGGPVRKGEIGGNDGSLERAPHTAVHIFGGSPTMPFNEDLGNFYSAGRDPLFYSHHANVDRMWDVWRSIDSGNVDFTDADYLNTEFFFFDENQDLVKCKVKDSLDATKSFKYAYPKVPQDRKWIDYRPAPANPVASSLVPGGAKALAAFPVVKSSKDNGASVKVGASPLTISVAQPKVSSGARDELLVLEDLEVTMNVNTAFNVFINYPGADEKTSPDCAEYVGSFYNIPHFMPGMVMDSTRTTNARFSIKKNVEILGLTASDLLTVTVVPRGKDKDKTFTFKGASIEYA